MVLLGINIPQFDKSLGKFASKTLQIETKLVSKYSFFMKILVNTTALKTQNESQSKHDGIIYNL